MQMLQERISVVVYTLSPRKYEVASALGINKQIMFIYYTPNQKRILSLFSKYMARFLPALYDDNC